MGSLCDGGIVRGGFLSLPSTARQKERPGAVKVILVNLRNGLANVTITLNEGAQKGPSEQEDTLVVDHIQL